MRNLEGVLVAASVQMIALFFAASLKAGEHRFIAHREGAPVWGDWEKEFRECPSGSYVVGFQLRMEEAPKHGNAFFDDISVTQIRIACSELTDKDPTFVNSGGLNRGKWRAAKFCPRGTVVYGYQLIYQTKRGDDSDDVGANGLRMFCRSPGEWRVTNQSVEDSGPYGYLEETPMARCPSVSLMVGIMANIERYHDTDNTALNDIKIACRRR